MAMWMRVRLWRKDLNRHCRRKMRRRIEQTTYWLSRLTGEAREKVEMELARQERALEKYLAGKMRRRTAERIVERSHKRVAFIVAGVA